MGRFRLACWTGLLLAAPLTAQPLLSPEAFLGYPLGTRFTPHHRVVAYFEYVARTSPRVQLVQYGETYEGRPLLLAIISSPENLARIEALRTDNLRRAGRLPGTPSPDGPVFVWLSYNVHGNEAVSTEAALLTLYTLAHPDSQRTGAWLEQAVVLLDPCLNPDGRERYVQWYHRMLGARPNPDPLAREHHEPWPGGRTNHYYFDLNRDWAWGTQQETRARLAIYQQWMPQIHVDFHEQSVDEPYYFAPAARPIHPLITDWQRALQDSIGRNHARYFDADGRLYFTREVFDLFYPGYGDTWPTFNGAIGMTYEQGGGGRAGLAIQTGEGDTLTLAQRIRNHYTTGLSTIEAAVRHRRTLLTQFARYFARAQTQPAGRYQAFLIRNSTYPDRLAALTALLEQQGIRYGTLTRARTVEGIDYSTGTRRRIEARPGDLVVSAYQPAGVLAQVLFDPTPVLPDSLTYDITSWALPYAFGLEAYALTERLEPDQEGWQRPALSPPSSRPYAYLVRWGGLDAARFLAEVLQRGVRVRMAEEPLRLNGQRFEAGTLILTRADNEHLGARFDPIVRRAARRWHQPLYSTSTGFVEEGPDLGSSRVRFLRKPHVYLLAGPPTSAYATGAIWHFFDQVLHYPVTLIERDELNELLLEAGDVLILPHGVYRSSEWPIEALLEGVRRGARLIALEGALNLLTGQQGVHLKQRQAKGDQQERTGPRRYGDREREAISDRVPGAIYRVQLDPTHPLAFGLPRYFTLKRSTRAYELLKDGWNVAWLDEGRPRSGFAGYRTFDRLRETLVVGTQRLGRGTLVFFVDDPLFRGFWHAGQVLFANAVFFGE
ncbi:M14 family metallopeptidase [Rhodothermus profundi]|uniref:Zinc carboxypeptidase n=1 Tax=Rhodothermus profundi TaxID=633813 RepID=A0A1M6RJ44_9BACT|nr:M14 family metallopeptidase [Rhodothermus profundi]SHK32377.1 Zinc carboxypeptidase [Rhodothermus profundi]